MDGRNHSAGLLDRLAFDFDKHRTIAVVGGGGKTSLIFRMAWELTVRGYTVCVTTTTHMKKEPRHPFAEGGDADQVRQLLKTYGYCMSGCTAPEKEGSVKISGLSQEARKGLKGLCDFLLIEADGSKGLPVKAPQVWEPVIPEETDLVIGVVGLDALDKPILETAHRPACLARILGKEENDRLTQEDLTQLALSEQGLRKSTGGKAFRVFLNKDDLPGMAERGEEICRQMKVAGILAVHGHLAVKRGELILLAAGSSRRFGSDKLLYECDGKPLFRHMLDKLMNIASRPFLLPADLSVTVVTRHGRVEEDAGRCGVKVCINPNPEEGIASSLRIGLSANRDCDFALFAVADQPWIREETIRGLLGGWIRNGCGMAALSFDETIGNPCIFSSSYFEPLLRLEGDKGGKRVLMKHLEDVFLYPAEDASEMTDLDYRPGR